MFSRTRKKNNQLNNKKNIIIIISIILLIIILSVLAHFVLIQIRCKKNFETDSISIYDNNNSNVFSIEKIILYSSANASSNDTTRDLWNLNIYQYTDIAIYLKNGESLNSKNTIKELSISNINYIEPPQRGTPEIYYKDIKNFGVSELAEENKITDKLNYTILNSNDVLDTKASQFYNTCQIPITLEYVNSNIKQNAIIPNDGSSIKFDGSLLQKANIPLNSINTNISFDVNIVNNLDEKYICKLNIPIPLENDNSNIYNGFIRQDLINIPNSNFLKLK